MYILTQENGIINVTYYRSVEVREEDNLYKIVAILPVSYKPQSRGDSTIAIFRNEDDAYYILGHIFEALVGNWDGYDRTDRYDARTVVLLDILWNNIKERLSSVSPDEVLDNLSLNSLNSRELKITIYHPSKSSEFYSEDNPTFLSERKKITDELNNTVIVNTPIQIIWRSHNKDEMPF